MAEIKVQMRSDKLPKAAELYVTLNGRFLHRGIPMPLAGDSGAMAERIVTACGAEHAGFKGRPIQRTGYHGGVPEYPYFVALVPEGLAVEMHVCKRCWR